MLIKIYSEIDDFMQEFKEDYKKTQITKRRIKLKEPINTKYLPKIAGSKTKSSKRVKFKATTVTIEKLTLGTKLLTPKMAKVKLRIKVVRIMAFPLWLMTWSMLSSKLFVLLLLTLLMLSFLFRHFQTLL